MIRPEYDFQIVGHVHWFVIAVVSPDGFGLAEQHYSGVGEIAYKERRHWRRWWKSNKGNVEVWSFMFGSF
jgi:hypothetical protein